jgi:hypothetical protein
MTPRPLHVIGIWDNGGETADRYTVALDPKVYSANPGRALMLGMSGAPSHPQGVSQFSEGQCGPHLGKRISWAKLPEHIRAHVAARLRED